MTVVGELSNAVIEHALTASLANREQDHHLHNTTPEMDSLAEILITIGANSEGEIRKLAIDGLRLIARVRTLNDTEHGCATEIISTADQLTAGRWTIKRLADELRPLLGDLKNPMVRGDKRDQRLARLAEIVTQAPERSLRSVSLRHELGVRKFTDLQGYVDASVMA